MISDFKKNQLEKQGCIVTNEYLNHKMYTFTKLPDGRKLKTFSSLSEIYPGDVNHNEEILLDDYAMPEGTRDIDYGADVYEYDPNTGYSASSYVDERTGKTMVAWWLLVIIIMIISITAVVGFLLCLSQVIEKWKAPCGIDGSVMEINDCWKLIIRPDCASRPFNSCTGPDNNGDGIPDGEWEEDSEWEYVGGNDWIIAALLLGVVGIGATAIGYALYKSSKRNRYDYGYAPRRRNVLSNKKSNAQHWY